MSGEYLGGSYLELTWQVVSQTVKIIERWCLLNIVLPAEGQEKPHPSQSAMILSVPKNRTPAYNVAAFCTDYTSWGSVPNGWAQSVNVILLKHHLSCLACLKSSHADCQVLTLVAWYSHLWHQKKKNQTGWQWYAAAVSSRPQLEISQLHKCSFDTLCGKNKLPLPRRVF